MHSSGISPSFSFNLDVIQFDIHIYRVANDQMARKKKPEEPENHERWLVSYADFITLLFAFFVVMYSVSSVNEGKFRAVSSSIRAALKPIVSPLVSTNPFKLGEHKPNRVVLDMHKPMEPVYRRLRRSFSRLPNEAMFNSRATIRENDRGIVITIQGSLMFEPGNAAAGINQNFKLLVEAIN